MVYTINKTNIIDLFDTEEMIELTVLEMHNKEFLVHIETSDGKNMSVFTNNWYNVANVL
jgi:hypothetical protein